MKSTEMLLQTFSKDLDLIKESLLLQKYQILNKNSEFKHDRAETEKQSDEGDAVSQHLQESLNIQLHERDRMSLILIEKALSKFANGSYGQCECCEEPIDLRRLHARPLATLCINCMEEQESLNKNSLQ